MRAETAAQLATANNKLMDLDAIISEHYNSDKDFPLIHAVNELTVELLTLTKMVRKEVEESVA